MLIYQLIPKQIFKNKKLYTAVQYWAQYTSTTICGYGFIKCNKMTGRTLKIVLFMNT